MHLCLEGVGHLVVGTEEPPNDPGLTPTSLDHVQAFRNWKRLDLLICWEIRATLAEHIQVGLDRSMGCRELYSYLVKQYRPEGSVWISAFVRQFQGLKLEDFESVRAYAYRFTYLQRQLRTAHEDAVLPQWYVNALFLDGLTHEYRDLRVGLEMDDRVTNPVDTMSWIQLTEMAGKVEETLRRNKRGL
ncbi:hypothetical protein BO94DRAFT_544961 [Aspergillus sclerotioniger CBS 115572]|uniref:Uncharacterized protein n=1 Tax=Aspergillus sclerotioniger CBS 115572 TaxID=1450535 RepID=A0A317X1X3_9EURO|nr:hypothetical protein BO94DRAFT_544961 [Aspergillus sclerotioniger CBS 115572]PWY91602.1 hypothetical protein BO94DRAFT_544961 [Aspergillus sclerotioniger CBS 115572]